MSSYSVANRYSNLWKNAGGKTDINTTGVILAGLGLAAIGFGGRYAAKHFRDAGKIFQKMESIGGNGGAFSKYYRGGFDAKMSRREASLILGVSPSASQAKIKEAHKRIMLLNHPDRGGSPYIAAKVNEAKDYLETKR